VKVGAALQLEVKESLVKLLWEYVDVLAWSYQDMPGLDTNIVWTQASAQAWMSTSQTEIEKD
jgi:hypothetical protein